MGFAESADREGLISSMTDVLRFQALFLRHFAGLPMERFGEEGRQAVVRALQRYGEGRGRYLRESHAAQGRPSSARALLEGWDGGDCYMVTGLGWGRASGSPGRATVTIDRLPEWEEWRAHRAGELARLYYENVWPAIARGYHPGARVELSAGGPSLEGPWSVTWVVDGLAEEPESPITSDLFDRPEEATAVVVRSAMNNGAVYFFLADEVTRRFDMMGEEVVRQAVRNLALERAAALKARHEELGLPLNLKTLMDHWDGNLVSVWRFNPGTLTEGTWHQDCTWCPYAAVWQEQGERALELGYLYDYELHPTLYRAYHPDAQVQFESIKTRGDAFCKFRVSIPNLQQEGEPKFAGYGGQG